MANEINSIRKKIKSNKNKANKKIKRQRSRLSSFINKFLITTIITLSLLITLKSNHNLKKSFYNQIYDKNISFSVINNWYEKYFGSPIPFKNLIEKETKTVFNEKINYSKLKKYKDGIKLQVEKNYLVPILESGMVVYIGEKENYNNTVIIQQIDGTDVWYGNIDTTNLKLYDYVEKGDLLGQVKDTTLYMVFKKEGKVVSYEKYL